MNVQSYILEQGIAARHQDLVREADAARLAARAPKRRWLNASRLGPTANRRERPGVQPTLEPEL